MFNLYRAFPKLKDAYFTDGQAGENKTTTHCELPWQLRIQHSQRHQRSRKTVTKSSCGGVCLSGEQLQLSSPFNPCQCSCTGRAEHLISDTESVGGTDVERSGWPFRLISEITSSLSVSGKPALPTIPFIRVCLNHNAFKQRQGCGIIKVCLRLPQINSERFHSSGSPSFMDQVAWDGFVELFWNLSNMLTDDTQINICHSKVWVSKIFLCVFERI